jgi:hypothetical protein
MHPIKGEGLATAATVSEARKIVGTGKRDVQASKPSSEHVQVSRRDSPVLCPACERKVTRKSRQQKFCSKRCAEKGRLRVRKFVLGQGTGVPADPHKSANKNNDLQRAISRSSASIIGPRTVVEAEIVAGRQWREVVSSSGVRSSVCQIRKSALIDRGAP